LFKQTYIIITYNHYPHLRYTFFFSKFKVDFLLLLYIILYYFYFYFYYYKKILHDLYDGAYCICSVFDYYIFLLSFALMLMMLLYFKDY
jgi:hypothetical protein